MELSAQPIPNPAAVARQGQDGWTVLVNLDSAASLTLNPTGAMVWRLVDGRRTVAEIAVAVRDQFDDAPPTVADDVCALLDSLAEQGLIGFPWSPDTNHDKG